MAGAPSPCAPPSPAPTEDYSDNSTIPDHASDFTIDSLNLAMLDEDIAHLNSVTHKETFHER